MQRLTQRTTLTILFFERAVQILRPLTTSAHSLPIQTGLVSTVVGTLRTEVFNAPSSKQNLLDRSTPLRRRS